MQFSFEFSPKTRLNGPENTKTGAEIDVNEVIL